MPKLNVPFRPPPTVTVGDLMKCSTPPADALTYAMRAHDNGLIKRKSRRRVKPKPLPTSATLDAEDCETLRIVFAHMPFPNNPKLRTRIEKLLKKVGF